MARILIADPDSSFALALREDLQARSWDVDVVQDTAGTIASLCAKHYDVAVIDSGGVGGRGLELLSAVRE